MVYATGNLLDSGDNGTLSGNATAPSGVTVSDSPWSSVTVEIPTFSATAAYRFDVSFAGAQPHDQVDQLVYNDVTSLGTGGAGPGLWTSQTATGLGNNGYGIVTPGTLRPDSDDDGMPDYWKAAVGLIRAKFGHQVREDVLENLLPKYFKKKMEEEELHPVGRPNVKDVEFKEGEPLKFKAEFEVAPEIELGEYRGVTVHYAEPEAQMTTVPMTIRGEQSSYAHRYSRFRVCRVGEWSMFCRAGTRSSTGG